MSFLEEKKYSTQFQQQQHTATIRCDLFQFYFSRKISIISINSHGYESVRFFFMAYKQHLMEDFTVNGADDECTLHKHRKGVAY